MSKKTWRRVAEFFVVIGGVATAVVFVDDVVAMVASMKKPRRSADELEPEPDDASADEVEDG